MYSAFYVNEESGCAVCNNEILKSIGRIRGVFGAELDRIDGRIVVSHTDEVSRQEIAQLLASLGFPEKSEPTHSINQ